MPRHSEYVALINDLYIMTRHKYILQRQDGQGYTTVSKPKLNDSLVRKHLKQELTLGVFSGQYLNKFICFDVDCKENSREVTQRLVETLQEQYGFDKEQILVSHSGSKGYHVELFFNKALSVKELHLFYMLVIKDVGADKTEIEFRNTYTQAVKLPLSLNWKTKQKCYLVDTETLEPVDDECIFDIKKVDSEYFLEQLKEYWNDSPLQLVREQNTLTLESDVAEDFEQVLANVSIDLKVDYQARIVEMLEKNSLLYPNSRHNSTLLIATFLKEQGYEQEDTGELIKGLLINTWGEKRHFFSEDTTVPLINSETDRLVDIVYKKDYKLGGKSNKPVRIYKEDVLYILQPKKIHLRQLLFSMLCHSRKHSSKDGSFYMTYKQMSEMGNTDNLGRLVKHVTDLEGNGLIEIIRRNERQEKSHLSKPNLYRMANQIAPNETSEFVELDAIKADDFGRVTAQLLTEQELKQLVTKDQFYKTFKQYYSA